MLYHPSISVSHNYDRHQIQCNRSYPLCFVCRCMCICVSVCTCECICIGASTCSSLCVAQCFVCTYTLVLIYSCQSCQPLRFGHSLLRPSALRYTVTLMMISLCSCLKKQRLFVFHPMRTCRHQVHQRPAPRVIFIGCAAANRHLCFKPTDQS